MTSLVLDEETGMRGQATMDWASTNGINMRFKAPRQKAWIVERHNEILRQALHATESQLKSEGIKVPFEQVLAIVTFMHNALIVINGATPYNAVIGRQAIVLPPGRWATRRSGQPSQDRDTMPARRSCSRGLGHLPH